MSVVPVYDGHGNMFGTLSRSGSNSYSIGDERYYDAWGDVNTSYATGMPWQRYCANLGHVQDDESDLIYMRARYYEPSTGRFVSQDSAMHGTNWYQYCLNAPTIYIDETGNFPWTTVFGGLDVLFDFLEKLTGINVHASVEIVTKIVLAYFFFQDMLLLSSVFHGLGSATLGLGAAAATGGLFHASAGFLAVGGVLHGLGALSKLMIIVGFAVLIRDIYVLSIGQED